jgi:hypothetical protein
MTCRWKYALSASLTLCACLVTGAAAGGGDRSMPLPGAVRATSGRDADTLPAHVGIGGFSASLFKFKVVNKDDPTDVAGGWQKADATLKFADTRQDPVAAWSCTVTVEMPLRTVAKGAISAEKAAEISAEVATLASGAAMRDKPRWVPAEFCNVWRSKMQSIFKDEPYKGYYVKVSA